MTTAVLLCQTQFSEATVASLSAVIFATETARVSFNKRSVITTINQFPSIVRKSDPMLPIATNYRGPERENSFISC